MAPYPLPVTTQRLVMQALSQDNVELMQQRVNLLRSERQRIADALITYTVVEKTWPSQANFLLLKVTNATNLVAAAAQAGILLRNQSNQLQLADCIRISIGTQDENNALLHFLQSYREAR